MKDIADLIARIFIAMIFFYEAYDKVAFYGNARQEMINFGWTFQPGWFLYFAIFCLVLGSALVLIGYYANLGGFLLLLYWIPFTIIVYSFWDDPVEIQRDTTLQFMRNLAICSGLLLLIANGSGKFSIKRMIHVLKVPND